MAVELSALPKLVRRKQRIGRGEGSGRGKTSGRGNKGQYARSKVRPGFEGGQMPLYRRLPKGGFKSLNRDKPAIVKVGALNLFTKNAEVTLDKLKEAGLVRPRASAVKLLDGGRLKIPLRVSVHRVSAGARKAVEAAGGSVVLIGNPPS